MSEARRGDNRGLSDELKERAKEYALDNYCRRYMNDPNNYTCNDLKDVEELAYIAGALTERNNILIEILKRIGYSTVDKELAQYLTKLQQEGSE